MPFDIQRIDATGQALGSQENFQRIAPAKRSYFYRDVAKRVIDVTLVLIAGVVIMPVLVLLALLVSLDGHSPIYSQLRVGRGGKIFKMYKLRTMVANADSLLETHLKTNRAAQAEWAKTQKLKNDPRITPVGRILRKISADELPQLLNVLLGDMALVGPRPMMTSQRELYSGTSYFELRPGITGPWQVSDRNESAFSERVRFDDDYNRKLAFSTDLFLMLRTIKVVVRGTGY